MPRVYLDSCIVIYLIQAERPIRESIRRALLPANAPAPTACFSDLTRLECRVWPLRRGATELLDRFDRFFASTDLLKLQLTDAVYDLAARLRAKHSVKTPDALHLAAAIHWGCDEVWTNDARLPSGLLDRIKVRILP